MNGNKQTGLTHLHVYNFVIYRMERGTVACILITACRSLRKIHGNSSHAFHELYGGIKDGRLHKNLTIQSQPSESHPRNREKEGATHRLYGSWTARLLSQLHETGVHPQKLSRLLAEEFHCTDTESVTGLFQFLINEGDRVSYQIMLPYLLSTENINEFESIIQKRFFGVERFIQQGKNLYRFVKYTEERRDPIIWINDLEKGIIGWDMGLLVSLARASQTCGHISKEQAWKYIEQAAQLCSLDLHTAEEIDKSFLLGKAMKSGKIEDWDRLLSCYSLLGKHRR